MLKYVGKHLKVFVSYSHKDRRELDRLKTHLSPFIQDNLLDLWDDTRINPGDVWKEELATAIEECQVAVLLISADFMASKFIKENELSPLIAAAERNGKRIIPVILSPTNLSRTKIAQFQFINPPSRPLSSMTKNNKEALWVKVAELIQDALPNIEDQSLAINNGQLLEKISMNDIEHSNEKSLHFKIPELVDYIKSGEIDLLLERRFAETLDEDFRKQKRLFWKKALEAFIVVIDDARFNDAEIFIEFQMPLSSARCNALLVGLGVQNVPNAVILEFKPWKYSIVDTKYKIFSDDGREIHPSEKIECYINYLKYYHQYFHGFDIHLYGCSFFLDMKSPQISNLKNQSLFKRLPEDYPLFGKDESNQLKEYLASRVGKGLGSLVASQVIDGSIRSSAKYLKIVPEILEGNTRWLLLDEQQLVFNTVISKVEEAIKSSNKYIFLVNGGPGTGKSAVALQLLEYALLNRWKVTHSTGSLALRTVLEAKIFFLKKKLLKTIYGRQVKEYLPVGLFSSFSKVAKLGYEEKISLDLVLADEAHRLWDFRKNSYNGRTLRQSDVPMIEEIVKAARVCVFFLDDKQAIRAEEIGTVENIWQAVINSDIPIDIIKLTTQFRCSGSLSYVNWIDYVMDFSIKQTLSWKRFQEYDFQVMNSMQEMQEKLDKHRHDGNTCRFVAGFCWPWSKPKADGTLVHDVTDARFNGWSAPWIERGDLKAKPLNHRYFNWATNEDCYSQVGSIYSIQGFEFDYIGLIFGEDLIWREERWKSDIDKNEDKTFKEGIKTNNQELLEKLKSIYRVLLTRGMKGTYVFFLDEETRKHFHQLMDETLA